MFGPGAIPYGFDLYELYPGRSYPHGQSSPGQSALILSILFYLFSSNNIDLQMLFSMPPFFFFVSHDLKVSKFFFVFIGNFYARKFNFLISVSLQPNVVDL